MSANVGMADRIVRVVLGLAHRLRHRGVFYVLTASNGSPGSASSRSSPAARSCLHSLLGLSTCA